MLGIALVQFTSPENLHDNEKTNKLKIFPLFTMVIFQCHISFPGCFPKNLPAF